MPAWAAAGDLRDRLILEARTDTDDSVGDPSEGWASIATNPEIWGRIEPAAGRERWVGERLMGEVDTVITIRYRSDITPKTMRVKEKNTGRVFNIEAALNMENARTILVLACKEQS